MISELQGKSLDSTLLTDGKLLGESPSNTPEVDAMIIDNKY